MAQGLPMGTYSFSMHLDSTLNSFTAFTLCEKLTSNWKWPFYYFYLFSFVSLEPYIQYLVLSLAGIRFSKTY